MKMERMPDSLSKFIRAGTIVGTFHGAVEEVILNSIDAGAKTIEIVLDPTSFSFEVTDDGKKLTFCCPLFILCTLKWDLQTVT